jgi:NAD/NADP transhydrogenase alpha subunit
MQHFIVFVLSVFIGFQVIWNVAHSLHTPLMAVTNAISSIIILGALMQIGSASVLITMLAALGLHGRGEHLRRLPRDTAHARHVPEILIGQG